MSLLYSTVRQYNSWFYSTVLQYNSAHCVLRCTVHTWYCSEGLWSILEYYIQLQGVLLTNTVQCTPVILYNVQSGMLK